MKALYAAATGMVLLLGGCGSKAPAPKGRLTARAYKSGFEYAHDTYNGISTASDGRIYYVLSSAELDKPAEMFVFDPPSGAIRRLGDLDEACGQKGKKMVCQGKSHVNFVESGGKLYFVTHIGYYSIIDDMEKPGIPPAGVEPYPGGHFLAYDIKSGKFEDLGTAPGREGIITMNMDTQRGRMYGITWPAGHFLRLDLAKRDLKDFGPISHQGENGKGPEYRTLCRSLAIDPQDGSVYFTNGDGDILRYQYEKDAYAPLEGEDLRKDYFGQYDPTSAGHMGYNWRQTVWYAPENAAYGVHGNSGYLFRFDPRSPRVDIIERITSEPSRRSGMFDQFSYGYLGFTLGPDGHTLYYLTGGPIYEGGKRVAGKTGTSRGEAKGRENLHLVTYDIRASRYKDYGPIFFANGERPTYVNSIAVGKDGTVYAISRISDSGKTRTDLFSVKP